MSPELSKQRVAGPSAEEAKRLLAEVGPNAIAEAERPSRLREFLANLVQLFALLLWAGAAPALLAGLPELSVAIVAVIIINAIFSYWSNRLLLIGIAVEVAMIALLAYTPGLTDVFHTSGLDAWHWLFLLIWPPLVLGAEEARKALMRRRLGATPGGDSALRRGVA